MKSPDNESRGVEPTLFELIDSQIATMRTSEIKVAHWILENPTAAAALNLAGLADAAGVSEPTVIRFCSAIGIRGFRQFKLALVRSLALGDQGSVPAVTREDGVVSVVSKTVDRTINALDRTRRHVSTEALDEAAKWLSEAKQILFIGAGSSGIVALDAQQKFPLLGVPCFAPQDFHEQFMAASMASDETILVAISNSGQTKTVLKVAQATREAGGKVVALVGDQGPLTRLADLVIRTSTFEDTEVFTPTVSRIAQLVVIDILVSLVALRLPDEHSRRVSMMKAALSDAARRSLS